MVHVEDVAAGFGRRWRRLHRKGNDDCREEATMVELLEKMVLSGLGALALSKSKGEELLAEVRDRYRLSEEEGRALLEKLQSSAQQGKESLAAAVENEVKRAIRSAGMVTAEEHELLEKRVRELELRLSLLAEDDEPEE
jgi:polyhydroxyalkanoate synthesis regulator phasin